MSMKRKVLGAILAVAAVLLVPMTASASATSWFQLEPGSSPGVVATQQGASGVDLLIDKPAGPGTFQINISWWVQTDAAPSPATAAVALDLATTSTNVTVGSNVFTGAGFNFTGNGSTPNLPQPPAANRLLADMFGSSFGPTIPPGSMQKTGTFTLTVVKTAPGVGAPIGIIAGTGTSQVYADNFFGGINVAYGSQPAIAGGVAGTLSAGPSIIISNVPEPATLALLGLGVVGLIRRRR